MTVTNQARCEQHYEQRYEQWAAPLRGRPGVVRALNIVNRGIVVVHRQAGESQHRRQDDDVGREVVEEPVRAADGDDLLGEHLEHDDF